jgi:methylated-DNA-[protein]-cysteine S-methyltransferase
MNAYVDSFPTPVGEMTAAVDERGRLLRLEFADGRAGRSLARDLGDQGYSVVPDRGRCTTVVEQLAEYFAGDRQEFDLAVAPRGSEFQLRVWEELRRIPYGTTISYGELARRLGRPHGSRAVGRANGTNPIAIVVPCHRVIGADGSLTGYGGGLPVKRALLALEGALPAAGEQQTLEFAGVR